VDSPSVSSEKEEHITTKGSDGSEGSVEEERRAEELPLAEKAVVSDNEEAGAINIAVNIDAADNDMTL
jgi:hypothetical protein